MHLLIYRLGCEFSPRSFQRLSGQEKLSQNKIIKNAYVKQACKVGALYAAKQRRKMWNAPLGTRNSFSVISGDRGKVIMTTETRCWDNVCQSTFFQSLCYGFGIVKIIFVDDDHELNMDECF